MREEETRREERREEERRGAERRGKEMSGDESRDEERRGDERRGEVRIRDQVVFGPASMNADQRENRVADLVLALERCLRLWGVKIGWLGECCRLGVGGMWAPDVSQSVS